MFQNGKGIRALLFTLLCASTIFALTETDYQTGLHLATRFFGANRCGDTANSWIGHDRCHWYDGQDNGVDLSGGWHDCGDHPKFGETGGYAAMVLLHGYVSFPTPHEDRYRPQNSSGQPNDIPDVLDEVKYYTDYALKLLKGDDFYFQVGTAQQDHQSCSTPKYQTENEPNKGGENSRPSYKVSGGGASNIAGMHSAVLSLMYLAYKEYDESYANKCKDMAIKLYEFGDRRHEAVSSKGGEAPYSDTTWADDMALAAALLYRVTDITDYKVAAINFMREENYNDVPTYFVLDYPTVSPIVQYEVGKHLFPTKESYKTPLKTEVEIHIDSMSSMGFAFFGYEGTSWGSLKYAAAAAYVGMLAYDLFPDSGQYKQFALDNVDFMMGDHGKVSNDIPSGFSFLAGFGTSDPIKQLHHSGAFGRTPGQWYEFNNGSVANNKNLAGALVGGPTTEDGDYENLRSNMYTNEVCIYYNAPFVSTLAALLYDDPDPQAPTDIRLSNSSVDANKADATVGTITVIDPNAGDTHTLELISGGDSFTISGTTLKTKSALSPGEITVKIKATDQTDLSYEKEIKIRVKDPDVGDEELCSWLGWYVYVDEHGSTVDTGSALLVDDKIPTAEFTMVTDDAANEKYVAGGLGSKLDSKDGATYLKGCEYIIIEYQSTEEFNFVVPSKGIDPNSGKSFYHTLPKATTWKLDTMKLSKDDFKQPSWVTEESDFDLSTSNEFNIAAAFQGKAGKIEVRTIKIDGLTPPDVPVVQKSVVTEQQFSVNSVNASTLNLSVPQDGYYTIQAFSLNGRKLGSFTTSLVAGTNNIPWQETSYFGTNVILFRVFGNGSQFTRKLVLK